jgi:penicillin amidase
VRGVQAPVEIVRDTHNVPHVFGQSDTDVFFGLGLAHAQDRLWQMTMMRRAAQGRLSEVFGARTVQTDELMRRFDLYGAAQASVEDQDAYTGAALLAYAAGVNAWIETVNTEALGRGAPEFFLFSPQIAPWRPADSLAVLKIMALQLSGHIQAEVLRAQVSLAISPDRLHDLLPDPPGAPVVDLPDYGALFPEDWPRIATLPAPVRDPLSPVQPLPFAGASNAWAAAPARSAAGGSLLANDPHLGLTAPTIWYLARLELASGGVLGATIPGLPLVLAGRTERLGWGITSAYLDDQDVFMEELNPANPGEYRTPQGWVPFETRREIIEVKDASPVTITLRNTQNGPVLPGGQYGLGTITPPGHVASIGWTALNRDDRSATAASALMRSGSIDAALAAMVDFVAPAQNLTMAEPDRIAMVLIGAIPDRDPAHDSRGRLPSLGWKAENRWRGAMQASANPRFIDPPSGLLGNTNNRTVSTPFPNHVSYVWGDTQRIQRWERLMQDREVHTRESFVDAQLDTVSMAARNLLPLIARDLWYTGEAVPPGSLEASRKRALDLLAEWNGEMNEHLPEPLIYAAWLRQLQQKLIRDDIGPLADRFNHPDPVFIERVFRNVDGAAVWCDIRQSSQPENCTDIARIALDEAILWLGQTQGSALESLRWGDAHVARHDHPVLGEVPVLKWLVNIRQSTSGGDHTLQRGRTAGDLPDPFHNVHAAGYRGVYDFADPDSSIFVTATGQSGHPLSRHYDDLGQLWRRGEYIPMTLDPNLARAGAVGTTRLLPAQ